MNKPERLLQNIDLYKTIMSHEYRQNYSDNYSEEQVINMESLLWKKRKPKIEKINKKSCL